MSEVSLDERAEMLNGSKSFPPSSTSFAENVRHTLLIHLLIHSLDPRRSASQSVQPFLRVHGR